MAIFKTFISLLKKPVFATAVLGITLAPVPAGADHATFKDEIFPILKKYCVECHQAGGEGLEKSGLDLTSYEGVMKGTNHGPIVIPGDAFSSNLNVLVEGRASPELKMPHARKGLTKWERLMLRRWVNRGAKNN